MDCASHRSVPHPEIWLRSHQGLGQVIRTVWFLFGFLCLLKDMYPKPERLASRRLFGRIHLFLDLALRLTPVLPGHLVIKGYILRDLEISVKIPRYFFTESVTDESLGYLLVVKCSQSDSHGGLFLFNQLWVHSFAFFICLGYSSCASLEMR